MPKLSTSSIPSFLTANVLCQCRTRGGCGYFQWYDDEMPAQARRVIWGLLKRVKTYELERN
ncbi:hypothetical protein H5410_013034 [Solanum commersonii]|uniref:Uncharacterized protein n=1 Tax=Solanum commersonii TaxID=4109 RepID=A0A9J6ATE0_SOLCO|nr:hypothetical protein H5410_013034 [Solanum commersonii]